MIESFDDNGIIATDRLDLVPLTRLHADSLFPVLSDESLYEFTGGMPPESVSSLRERFAYLEKRQSPDGSEVWLNWLLRHHAEAIGYVQSTVTVHSADVAWVIGSPWQGQGYATEAASAMIRWLRSAGVRAFRANIHPAHSASQRVAGKLGLSLTDEVADGEQVWRLSAGADVAADATVQRQ